MGQHPLVSRTIKGSFHERPPQPRYSVTWDVATVTKYMESLGENESLSLAEFTHKIVMLFALTRPSRSADPSQLHPKFRRYIPEGVTFQPIKLAKQSRQTKQMAEFFFQVFPANSLLCPVVTLQAYEARTRESRQETGPGPLFLTTIRPHNPASSSTIARWLKSILGKAGVDTAVFRHTHKLPRQQPPMQGSPQVTFSMRLIGARLHKPSKQTEFGRAVLDSDKGGKTTNTH